MSKQPQNYCPLFGNYPKEYNRAVHGPYYPWVNYGPKDTPFKDVKLGELKDWFARRQKTPAAALAVVSRASNDYLRKWMHTRYGSPSKGILQIVIMSSVMSLLLSYGYYRNERSHKYHW
jgi:F-type H+-transporting ATPase subunit f